MNGLTVSVGYDDLLSVTLPRNAHHFDRILVVTSPTDRLTPEVVDGVHNARLFVTDAFYRDGADFNKGRAIEEGLTRLGHTGWLCHFDADILMPDVLDLSGIRPGNLYTPRRRELAEPQKWAEVKDWSKLPRIHDLEHAGFFQLFHADDPVLKTRPWYSINWRHAAGSDSEFQQKWPPRKKIWLPFDVLHLGTPGPANWFGRSSRRIDGTLPPDHEEHARAARRMLKERRKHGFRFEKL